MFRPRHHRAQGAPWSLPLSPARSLRGRNIVISALPVGSRSPARPGGRGLTLTPARQLLVGCGRETFSRQGVLMGCFGSRAPPSAGAAGGPPTHHSGAVSCSCFPLCSTSSAPSTMPVGAYGEEADSLAEPKTKAWAGPAPGV